MEYEVNNFRIKSSDTSKKIYRLTIGNLISEEKRKTHPMIGYGNKSGDQGFLDYKVNQGALEILIIGIEPEHRENGCKNKLLLEAGKYAKENKLEKVIHFNNIIYTKKDLKTL